MVRKTPVHSTLLKRVAQLPDQPGVYFFKDAQGQILYVGKALSLRTRVRSYFRPSPGTRRRWVGEGSAGTREGAGRPSPGTRRRWVGEGSAGTREGAGRPSRGSHRRRDGEGRTPLRPAFRPARFVSLREAKRSSRGSRSAGGREAIGRPRPSAVGAQPRTLTARVAQMVRHVTDIEVRRTQSEAEALLLEAQLIKDHQPHYNVAFRDDKAYPMLKVTNEPFPKLCVVRRKQADGAIYFGPYTDAGLMHEAVRFMRRVFPLRTCKTFPKTPCLEYHLGQCLAPCVHYIDAQHYQRIIDDLIAFLEGKRDGLLRELSRRMKQASRDERFEEAARLRDQIQALTSVIVAKEKSLAAGPLEQLQAALKLPHVPQRIEAFDISHVFGAFAVGSMVVFREGRPHPAHYRRFKIETASRISARGGSAFGGDDYQMMREVIHRRYSGTLSKQLPPPDLILIDGGKGQLSAACEELAALALPIPPMGLAKRFEHIFLPGTQEPIVLLPTSPVLHLLQHIRDEAHRFALTYHRLLRGKSVAASVLHEIPGIGTRRASRLMAHFGSVKRLRKASPSEVARIAGVRRAKAEEVLRSIGQMRDTIPEMPGTLYLFPAV